MSLRASLLVVLVFCLRLYFVPNSTPQPLPERAKPLTLAMQEVSNKNATTSGKVNEICYYLVSLHISDNGNNSGYWVEKMLHDVHCGIEGAAWCGAATGFVLDSAKVQYPKVRSALAKNYITDESIDAREVLLGRIKLNGNYVVTWTRGGNSGHSGITEKQIDNESFWTFQGNTSAGHGKLNEEFNGDTYAHKIARIEPGNVFRIIKFTPIKL